MTSQCFLHLDFSVNFLLYQFETESNFFPPFSLHYLQAAVGTVSLLCFFFNQRAQMRSSSGLCGSAVVLVLF